MSRLAEIEGRLSAATPGPWEHVERRHDGGRIREHSVETHHHVIADDLSLNSAELIAHAPTDLAALLKVARVAQQFHQPRTHLDVRSGTTWQVCVGCISYAGLHQPWPCDIGRALAELEGQSAATSEARPGPNRCSTTPVFEREGREAFVPARRTECPCAACDPGLIIDGKPTGLPSRMNVCPDCGNKRCPKAANHARWQCSGSNEPGQVGVPVEHEHRWVDQTTYGDAARSVRVQVCIVPGCPAVLETRP